MGFKKKGKNIMEIKKTLTEEKVARMLINLTGKNISLLSNIYGRYYNIPSTEPAAYINQDHMGADYRMENLRVIFSVSVNYRRTSDGELDDYEIIGLPSPQEGVFYITNSDVARVAAERFHRDDVLCLDDIKSFDGDTVTANALKRFA